MDRKVSWIPTLLALLLFAAPATATLVVVPGGFPTIQAAIDSGADTVDVRDSLPPERLTVSRCVTIEPAAKDGFEGGAGWVSMPRIQSLELGPPSSDLSVRVRGMHFLGQVRSTLTGHLIGFEGCRFDSGFAAPTATVGLFSSIRDCLFLGDVSIAGYAQFIGNTVLGGTLTFWADGLHDIRDNYVQGPAKEGMNLSVQDSGGSVSYNTIRGTSTGIHYLGDEGGSLTSHNEISDCSSDGIYYDLILHIDAECDSNLIQRCGGAGIAGRVGSEGPGDARLRGNVIRHVGGSGIDLPECFVSSCDNQIVNAGEDGINAGLLRQLKHNVVGQCRGTGIRVSGEIVQATGNTIYSCGGPGIDVTEAFGIIDSLFNNISAFNGGPGLHFGGSHLDLQRLGCNDWFGNGGGPTVGISPAASDLELDPRFCSLSTGDVQLAANSPLLAAPGCGLIGALGVGCGATAAIAPADTDRPSVFQARPVPARGAVEFELPTATAASRLEVFDVIGAVRWQATIPAGATRVQWDAHDAGGRRAPPGVYFARLTRAGAPLVTVRVVLAK